MKYASLRLAVILIPLLIIGAGVAGVAATPQEQEQEQQEQTATARATQARGTGPDENIKSTSDQNDPNAPEPPVPQEKADADTRGALLCRVQFDNRTRWRIQLYLDGYYEGLMPAWGDVYRFAIPGRTVVYARADFTDGSRLTWGPHTFDCPVGGRYRWRLTP